MKHLILTPLLLLAISASSQEIALSFDDAPTHDGPVLSGDERTSRIISHLKKEGLQAAFFVVTGNIMGQNRRRLDEYMTAGHLLANHSNSHKHIHEIGISAYLQDVQTAHGILKEYPAYRPWFRYPFLDEGRTGEARDSIRTGLIQLGLSNGYVTVDNYDWYINSLLRNAVREKKQVNTDVLRDIYIDHVFESITFYDSIAVTHLGRSPRHVLLLHENDLAALFLGDLIQHLRKKGWKVISPERAYEDAVASTIPDVLFNGQGRVAALARAKGIPPMQLIQKSEDEMFLDQLVKDLKAFK